MVDHKKWIQDIDAVSGNPANFSIIDDTSPTVAKAYNMLPIEAYLPDDRTRQPDSRSRFGRALGLDDAQASAHFDTLDIRLPYLRFAKAPN